MEFARNRNANTKGNAVEPVRVVSDAERAPTNQALPYVDTGMSDAKRLASST